MSEVSIKTNSGFDTQNFWINNLSQSTGERFTGLISVQGTPLTGHQVFTYSGFEFDSGGLTYKYIGNWNITYNNGLLVGTASASGTYNQIEVHKGSQLLAQTSQLPLSVDFGTNQGAGLLNIVNNVVAGVVEVLFGASAEQKAFANLNLDATQNLQNVAFADGLTAVGGNGADLLQGSSRADILSGGAGNDQLRAGAGNDTLNGQSGDDLIIGGTGHDTTNFSLDSSHYIITQTGALTTVRSLVGSEGTDYVTGVETLHFGSQHVQNIGLIGDLNGDGRGDFLQQNENLLGTWFMDGVGIKGSGLIAQVGDDWSVVDVGDTNADGRADLLLQKGQSLTVWNMNGTSIEGGAVLGNMGDGWMVAGMGDVNGDGRSDVVMQNGSLLATWLLDGSRVIGSGMIGDIGQGGQVAGIGDIDGDGRSDVIIQNGTTLSALQLNGSSVVGGGIIGQVSSGSQIKGLSDLDGDGQSDLIVQNDQLIYGHKLNGAQISESGIIGQLGTGWQLAGIEDMNGDGRADLVLQNGSQLVEWQMNGLQISAAGLVDGAFTNGWEFA